MEKSLKLFRIFGIDVELHYTWFIIFLLLGWSLSYDFFPYYFPGLSANAYWLIGSVSAMLLFASVLCHELAHSLVAKKNKLGVHKITLFFFGGIAQIKGEEIDAKKELTMAVSGPLVSLLIAFICFVLLYLPLGVYLNAIFFYLARLNLILAIFNMVPGFPLDGGRVFRAILWMYYKDARKATIIASKSGRFFAGLFVFIGIFGMFFGFATLWFILIGIFLYFMAESSYEQIVIKDILEKKKVKEFIEKKFIWLNENITIAELFESSVKYGENLFIVLKNKNLIGLVSTDLLKKVPRDKWNAVKIRDYITPNKHILTANKNDNAYLLFMKMINYNIDIAPVLEKGKIIGVVSLKSVLNKIKGKIKE